MKILVVEDDDNLRSVWKEALLNLEHDVVDVHSTKSAMAHLLTTRFDLAILDLMIGDANSLALTHYVAYAVPDTRVMVITGSGLFPRGGVTDIAPGVDWLLRKPLSLNDFTAMVSHAETLCGAVRQIPQAPVPEWVEFPKT